MIEYLYFLSSDKYIVKGKQHAKHNSKIKMWKKITLNKDGNNWKLIHV